MIGKHVKIVPPDLVSLSKGGFLYDQALHETQGELDNCVMLGGEYEVVAISQNECLELMISSPRSGVFKISKGFAVPISEVNYCPFQKGNLVRLRESTPEIDQRFMQILGVSSGLYEVRKVLNGYFVFLNEIDNPFFWHHFELVEVKD